MSRRRKGVDSGLLPRWLSARGSFVYHLSYLSKLTRMVRKKPRSSSNRRVRDHGRIPLAYLFAILAGLTFGISLFAQLSVSGVFAGDKGTTTTESIPQDGKQRTHVDATRWTDAEGGADFRQHEKTSAAEEVSLMAKPELPVVDVKQVVPTIDTVGSVPKKEESTQARATGPFRIIVLTMNRPWALRRLLESVSAVNYQGDHVDMDIFVDMMKSKSHDAETVQVANDFSWAHGTKRVVLQPRNRGLILSWLTCWNATSDDERAIILEDDLEVSLLYYRFLREADALYKDVEDLAAFSLQRATLIPKDEGFRKVQHGEHRAYMYKLVGTWGFAPRAKFWTRFQSWFFERWPDKTYKPYVDGLKINKWYNGREWSNWFLRFCDEEGLFNLYGNMPEKTTLCANWREPGEHYGKGPAKGREFPIFEAELDFDLGLPQPDRLIRLDWNAQLHPKFHSEFYRKNMEAVDSMVEYAQGAEFLALGLYNGYFTVWVRNFLCNVELLGVTPEHLMFATNDKKAHDEMKKLGIKTTLLTFQGAESQRGTTFSTPGYIEFMLNRARLVLELLRNGVPTLLFDPDQTWLEDPMPYVREKLKGSGEDIGPVDLVGTVTTQNELAGNFLLFEPTECTIRMYDSVVKKFEEAFEKKGIGREDISSDKVNLSNDQTLITSYALRNRMCNLQVLDEQLFCDGRWYKGAYSKVETGLRPVTINNNFVEGNDEKMHRATGFGHMFFNTKTHHCEVPPKLRAYYKGASVYYSWEQVLNKASVEELLSKRAGK